MAEPLLAIADLRAGYGPAVVLDGVSFDLAPQGGLAVLGRNGVGKSTLLLTLMGYTRVSRGRILWRGADITYEPPHRRARAGIGWVAQETGSFTLPLIYVGSLPLLGVFLYVFVMGDVKRLEAAE